MAICVVLAEPNPANEHMSDTGQKPNLDEMTKPRERAGDSAYLAWAGAKTRKAVADDAANPEGRASLDAVMRKHGVR